MAFFIVCLDLFEQWAYNVCLSHPTDLTSNGYTKRTSNEMDLVFEKDSDVTEERVLC